MKCVDVTSKSTQLPFIPSRVRIIIELCKTIPDDEGWTTRRIAEAMRCSLSITRKSTTNIALKPYKIYSGNNVYWANAKTVKQEAKRSKDGKK